VKISSDRESLLAALERARRVVPSEKSIDASGRARLNARDSALTIYGTDLTVFVASRLAADVVKPGEIGVAPADLAEMVRRMPDGAITLSAAEGRLSVSGAGTKRAFKLPYVETADLPSHNGVSESDVTGATVLGDVIAAHLKRVIPAAYTFGDRPHMSGVGFDGSDMFLRLVATDGLRVAVTDVESAPGDGGKTVRLLHLAAARVLAAEAAEMGSISLIVDERGFSFSSHDVDIFVPHVSGNFPPYEFILSTLKTHTGATVTVRSLLDAVNAMAAVSKVTKLTLGSGTVKLHAQGTTDVAEDEVEAALVGPGGVIHVSTQLLLDCSQGVPESDARHRDRRVAQSRCSSRAVASAR
jgi:DNA polymerase-3 subunit beta